MFYFAQKQKDRGAPGRGSKWFVHLLIPQKLTKSKFANFPCPGGGGGGGGEGEGVVGWWKTNFQLLMLRPNLLKSQISMSSWRGGGEGEGLVESSFQLLMPSPNLLRSKNIFTRGFAENF